MSKVSPLIFVAVRQTPLVAIESPIAMPSLTKGARIVSVRPPPWPLTLRTISPVASISPVNTGRSKEAGARGVQRLEQVPPLLWITLNHPVGPEGGHLGVLEPHRLGQLADPLAAD